MQFNKGSALFKNRIQSLERLISVEKPDILCLSETNLDKNDIQHINYFEKYYHEYRYEVRRQK